MGLHEVLRQLHDLFDGLNPPASERQLTQLQDAVGQLPAEILSIYRDHNGAAGRLSSGTVWLPARLMPVDEAVKANTEMVRYLTGWPSVGNVAWIWTDDDHCDYVGVYVDGLLQGRLTRFWHDEAILTPVYRSAGSFLERLFSSAPGIASREDSACDLVTVPREIPLIRDEPQHVGHDRELVAEFRRLYASEQDDDLRRLYAMCAICLTPVADTQDVLSFLDDKDMWTPEAAVELLELRYCNDGVDRLEKLARDGTPNGDSAAMRLLVRMGTKNSGRAVERLRSVLTGQKLSMLEMWARLLPAS
jgi:hypothetical protein